MGRPRVRFDEKCIVRGLGGGGGGMRWDRGWVQFEPGILV